MNDDSMMGAGPKTPEEMNAMSQQGAMSAIGQAAPRAKEPLDPETLNTLGEIAVQTAQKLAGDEAQIPPVAPVSAPADQLPPDLYSLMVVFDGFTQEALPEFKFDLNELATTNTGLKELTGLLGELGGADPMAKAKKAAPPKAEEPTAKSEPAKPDAKRFIKKKPSADDTAFTAPSTMGPTV